MLIQGTTIYIDLFCAVRNKLWSIVATHMRNPCLRFELDPRVETILVDDHKKLIDRNKLQSGTGR